MHIRSATLDHPTGPIRPAEWTIYPTGAGTFACGSPDGLKLNNGQAIKVYLAGSWVEGFIDQHPYQQTRFVSLTDQSVCGLCPGMRIILLRGRRDV